MYAFTVSHTKEKKSRIHHYRCSMHAMCHKCLLNPRKKVWLDNSLIQTSMTLAQFRLFLLGKKLPLSKTDNHFFFRFLLQELAVSLTSCRPIVSPRSSTGPKQFFKDRQSLLFLFLLQELAVSLISYRPTVYLGSGTGPHQLVIENTVFQSELGKKPI